MSDPPKTTAPDSLRRVFRVVVSIAGVAVVTALAHSVVPVNATTAGFAYLLVVLLIASTWGFVEASLASVAATLAFNFFFLPPIGAFTIADPQNWVALFSFLTTALVTSRLSAKAERRALDALERKHDVERLYTFSRAILLIGAGEPFARQIANHLVDIFQVNAAVLFERRTGEIHRSGPAEFEGLDDQLRDAAQHGTSFSDTNRNRVITSVRLGSEPIASLALQGIQMPDSVVQGIANLVAIGLERSRAQDLSRQIEVARQAEQLRTALVDAMAHEFKTPLTAIRAATSSLLESPDQPTESRTELLKVADEEAQRLTGLIDDAIDLARLDSAHIDLRREKSDLCEIVGEVAASLRGMLEERSLQVDGCPPPYWLWVDRRLLSLAIKQLLENSIKYSPPGSPVKIVLQETDATVALEIVNAGKEIPPEEQSRVFERFYRSPSVSKQLPGSGLGLSIARSIARAHDGDLTVTSSAGETTFRILLPTKRQEQTN